MGKRPKNLKNLHDISKNIIGVQIKDNDTIKNIITKFSKLQTKKKTITSVN